MKLVVVKVIFEVLLVPNKRVFLYLTNRMLVPEAALLATVPAMLQSVEYSITQPPHHIIGHNKR